MTPQLPFALLAEITPGTLIATAVCAVALGAALVWFFARPRWDLELQRTQSEAERQIATLQERVASRDAQTERLEQDAAELEREIDVLLASESDLKAQQAELETRITEERKAAAEKLKFVTEAETKLKDAFEALSLEALRRNRKDFLELAEDSFGDGVVKPLKESLEKVDTKINALEKARAGAYEQLREQVKSMSETQRGLQSETANLVKALRQPTVRGRWGEMQLQRVVELAGMQAHCDFSTQESTTNDEGSRLRPDMIVKLPGGKTIVIDAKTPLSAYLEAVETKDDAAREAAMRQHARQVREHINLLSKKAYWEQFEPTPEFVVLFLPGETFFSAALETDPTLIEIGVEQGVILATPTTLISLLRAVAYGWRQERLTQNAREISNLGSELYKRIGDMTRHMTALGKGLTNAVGAYNKSLGTLESRVLVSARKLKDLDAAPESLEVEHPAPIEAATREIQASELIREIAPKKIDKTAEPEKGAADEKKKKKTDEDDCEELELGLMN